MDIAIDWLPAELDPFINRKLFDDRLVLVAQTGSPLSRCWMSPLEDLLKAEFVDVHIIDAKSNTLPMALQRIL